MDSDSYNYSDEQVQREARTRRRQIAAVHGELADLAERLAHAEDQIEALTHRQAIQDCEIAALTHQIKGAQCQCPII